jgi:hypothetical protein
MCQLYSSECETTQTKRSGSRCYRPNWKMLDRPGNEGDPISMVTQQTVCYCKRCLFHSSDHRGQYSKRAILCVARKALNKRMSLQNMVIILTLCYVGPYHHGLARTRVAVREYGFQMMEGS